jgi:hypothetical protein
MVRHHDDRSCNDIIPLAQGRYLPDREDPGRTYSPRLFVHGMARTAAISNDHEMITS